MESLVIQARCIGEPLTVEAWQVGDCSCGCNGGGRQMVGFDGVVDGEVTVKDAVAPEDGRIVWLSGEYRFVMEVATGDNIEYYASWRGHSAYQPENFDDYVYYIANGDNPNDWKMYTADTATGLEQISGSDDESLSLEEIDMICQ
ncbi:hypothetical protein [Xylanibacter rodentium]|uniref:hypothetical protein n=1 Tax=Xylanibacter rodentium TaxID=2736289 RepID=UPI0025897892|nr:hypothetical protein [Xylanibacter rodentium]